MDSVLGTDITWLALRLATRRTVRVSNLRREKRFSLLQTVHTAHEANLFSSYSGCRGSFLGITIYHNLALNLCMSSIILPLPFEPVMAQNVVTFRFTYSIKTNIIYGQYTRSGAVG
jgi:hypothetical protein